MSAAAALQQARAAGVAFAPEENLMLTALAPPRASVIAALGRHKAEVLALFDRRLRRVR